MFGWGKPKPNSLYNLTNLAFMLAHMPRVGRTEMVFVLLHILRCINRGVTEQDYRDLLEWAVTNKYYEPLPKCMVNCVNDAVGKLPKVGVVAKTTEDLLWEKINNRLSNNLRE